MLDNGLEMVAYTSEVRSQQDYGKVYNILPIYVFERIIEDHV